MNLKSILGLIFVCSFGAINFFAQPLSKKEADQAWAMLTNAQTEKAFIYFNRLFDKHGARPERANDVGLLIQDYKEIINLYDNGKKTIKLSRMMSSAESESYWENWNQVLARGGFDHKRFFKDKKEKHLMANYNVMVLAAHELGHYYDYLYAANPRSIYEEYTPLNCSEGFADKFAVAVMNYLGQDARFANLRRRYLDIAIAFNEAIPKENRFYFKDVAMIHADCGKANLMENGLNPDNSVNSNFFQKYVSAYFNRIRLMLENRQYKSIPDLIDRELTSTFNYSGEKINLRTIGEYKGKGEEYVEGDPTNSTYYEDFHKNFTSQPETAVEWDELLLNEKGEIRRIRIVGRGKKSTESSLVFRVLTSKTFDLEILDGNDRVIDSGHFTLPEKLAGNYMYGKIILSRDGEVIVAMLPYLAQAYVYGSKADPPNYVTLVKLSKAGSNWAMHAGRMNGLPNTIYPLHYAPSIFVTTDGSIYMADLGGKDEPKGARSYEVRIYRIDPATLEPILTKTIPRSVFPKWGSIPYYDLRFTAYDLENIVVRGIWESRASGLPSTISWLKSGFPTLVGGISSYEDGAGQRTVDINRPFVTRFVAPNKLIFLDTRYEAETERIFLRELVIER